MLLAVFPFPNQIPEILGLKITKKCNLLHQAAWQKQILNKDQCAVSLHTYSFQTQLCFGWGGLGAEGQGHRSQAQAGLDAGPTRRGRHTPLREGSCLGPAVKARFPWSPSSLVPSPGSGRRSKRPWKTASNSDPEFILLPWGDISFCSSLPFPIIT